MYSHSNQYRCDIIRGKSQKDMDDLLPAYAKVIDEICPCDEEEFEKKFNSAFAKYLPESQRVKKTLDNHRTEISGKLFGMYYITSAGKVFESERTQKFLEDNDQPAFFKDVCYKMQFPNGMQKTKPTVIGRVEDEICLRPYSFILKYLQIAETAKIETTVKDIGYYILNSKDVLQGKATPYEVLEVVADDKKKNIIREIKAFDEDGKPKASSYNYQHIRELLNYLELANLIRIIDDSSRTKRVVLNKKESETIDLFAEEWNKKPEFDVYSFDLGTSESRKYFQYRWDSYYARLSAYASAFMTKASALVDDEEEMQETKIQDKSTKINLTEFGDEGEALVFEYEKNRVKTYKERLANKVLSLGKTKGIGYDIQSVIAEPGDMEEFVHYIEVKSTKRLTVPSIDDELWIDTLNITRNEYIAAQQHGAFYSIYRVYFTREGVTMFLLKNVAQKINDGKLQVTPMTYRVDFSNSCVDGQVTLREVGTNDV